MIRRLRRLCACTHACTHAWKHICMHACMQVVGFEALCAHNACMHTCMHACLENHICMHTCKERHSCMYMYFRMHRLSHTDEHTRTCTHGRADMDVHTRIEKAHIHACMHGLDLCMYMYCRMYRLFFASTSILENIDFPSFERRSRELRKPIKI